MALARLSKFNWDSILTKIEQPELKRAMNVLRGKSNEIGAASSKFVKDVDPIDFSAYKQRLKFTGAAVDDLEKVYKNIKLPQYTASLPAFEATKRASVLEVVKSTVDAAKADLELLNAEVAAFEEKRITEETTIDHLSERFPDMAREVEAEIKEHQWYKK